jgi:plastocyanin
LTWLFLRVYGFRNESLRWSLLQRFFYFRLQKEKGKVKKMKRLALVLVCTSAIFALGFTVYFQVLGQDQRESAAEHHDRDRGGGDSQDSATVSFGGWMANPHQCPGPPPAPCPIVDRFPANAATQFPRFSNHHELTPTIAKIKAGGTVNFIIGGLHVVTVYDDGTKPGDIDTTILVPDRPPMTPPIIDDAEDRIYRGLDPFVLPPGAQQDRVEVVQFDRPGKYLVICAVLPHFQEGMYGFVQVTGRRDHDDDDATGK